jgi:hypothetical protein
VTTAREAVEESGAMDSLFDASLADRIQADLDAERGSWGWDPDVDGVVGFWVRNSLGAREVVVILYLKDDDFECNSRYAAGVEL